MPTCKHFLFFVTLCLALGRLPLPVQAQAPLSEPAHPRIGLVLEGGAALGLAHVGVLQWFEEHHIPVSYISGTSMGGLIGGAYATGMTPEQMRSLLSGIDWTTALSTTPPYDTLPFRRKEDARKIPTALQFGVRNGGVRLPIGITPAQPIGAIFSRIGLPYGSGSFDLLPIPFRCMATDIETGEPVVLKDGPLDTALRATMAIPGVFTPVIRDGKLLVDGGLVNNAPTEAVKAMGADVIIVVDLNNLIRNREEIDSLIPLLTQTQSIMTLDNERRSLALAKIIISPDLGKLNAADFGLVEEFSKRGYAAAESSKSALLEYALKDKEWAEYLAQRSSRQKSPALTPRFVHVVDVPEADANRLAKRLSSFLNTPLKPEVLESRLWQVTGEGRFKSLLYERTEANGQDGLLIRAIEDTNRAAILNVGLFTSVPNRTDVQSNLATRLTMRDVGAPGREIRFDLGLGSVIELGAEYFRPLGDGHYFLAPAVSYTDVNENVYKGSSHAGVYNRRDRAAEADLGYEINPLSQVRVGYRIGRYSGTEDAGIPVLGSLSGDYQAAVLKWTFDQQNSSSVPTQGTFVRMTSNFLMQAPDISQKFPITEVRLERFSAMNPHDSVFGVVWAGSNFGYHEPLPLQFTLGGPFRLSAYQPDIFRGSSYLLLASGYLRTVARLAAPIGGRVLLGSWLEYGGASNSVGSGHYNGDIAFAAVAETGLGPITLGTSLGEYSQRSLFFAIGPLF